MTHIDPRQTASLYLGQDSIQDQVGSGIDGIVYFTSRGTAIKVHHHRVRFERELAVYKRLAEHRVHDLQGVTVPELLAFDTQLMVIEMTVVQKPYLLDFAKCHLDQPIDFGPDVMEEWVQRLKEEFGENWSRALSIYNELSRRLGIYHYDLSPRNLDFGSQSA